MVLNQFTGDDFKVEDEPRDSLSTTLTAHWNGITVKHSRLPPGEFDVEIPKHIVSVALTSQDYTTWRVDRGSSQTTPLPPDSVFLYASREFVWSCWSEPTECLHMAIEPMLMNRVAAECSLASHAELDYRIMFADPTILHVAHLLKAEMHSGGLAGQLFTESLTNVLAVHLLRNYSGLTTKPSLENGPLNPLKLNQVKDFIESRLAEDLTLASMAAIVHLSPYHFARAFKQATGQPPHRYLTARRIERAKMLLAVTRLTVSDVAYRVGLSNQSHFTAQFRRATGMTPKRYRDSL